MALGLDASNFYLLGHSWGGILAIEYALVYQQHLKGLIISNMMASIPEYNSYAANVLMPTMEPSVLAQIKELEAAHDYENPLYMDLLMRHHYVHHVLRRPPGEWPDSAERSIKHINPKVYIPMQGPSELGASGKLVHWDRTADLCRLAVPTMTIGARHDTMDPKHMEAMARAVQHGLYLYLPDGSHMSMFDDQDRSFAGVIDFLRHRSAAMSRTLPSSDLSSWLSAGTQTCVEYRDLVIYGLIFMVPIAPSLCSVLSGTTRVEWCHWHVGLVGMLYCDELRVDVPRLPNGRLGVFLRAADCTMWRVSQVG